MSDSQFEDLTTHLSTSVSKKQLQQKTQNITMLNHQINQLKQSFKQEHEQSQKYYQLTISQKQQTILELTQKIFKLSNNFMMQQKSMQKNREALEEREKKYQQLLDAQLQEKYDLLITIDQLQLEVKKQQEANSLLLGQTQKIQQDKLLMKSFFYQEKQTLVKETQFLRGENLMLKINQEKIEEQNETYRRGKQTLENKLESLEKEAKQLKTQKRRAQSENDQLRKQKQQLVKYKKEQQDKVQQLIKQLQEQRDKSQYNQKEMKQCRYQITYLQTQLNMAKSCSTESLVKYHQVLKRVDELQQVKNSNEQRMKQQQFEIKKQHQELVITRENWQEQIKQASQVSSQLEEKQNQLLALHITINQLHSQLQKSTINQSIPKHKHKQQQQQQQQSLSSLSSFSSQSKSLQQKVDRSGSRIVRLQKQLKQFQDLFVHLSDDAQTYRLENMQLRQLLLLTMKNLAALQQKGKSLEILKKSLEVQVKPQPESCFTSQSNQQSVSKQLHRLEALEEQNKQLIKLIDSLEKDRKIKQNYLNQQIIHLSNLNSSLINQLQNNQHQLNLKQQQLNLKQQQLKHNQQQLKHNQQQLNSLLNQLPNLNSFEIQHVYHILSQISSNIHQNIAAINQSIQEKNQTQLQQKTIILDHIKNILFNHPQYIPNQQMINNKEPINNNHHPNRNKNLFFPKQIKKIYKQLNPFQ